MEKTSSIDAPADAHLVPRVKVWLELDGEYVFGLGVCEMLEAIDSCGSMKDAAEQLGKSYRHVWGRIKRVERALGQQLVESRVGGKPPQRSRLTPRARQLVADFSALRRRTFDVVEQEYASRFGTAPQS